MSVPEPENRIAEALLKSFPEDVKIAYVKQQRIKVMVGPKKMVGIAEYFKKLGFDQVTSVGGTDYPKESVIEVNYHLNSVGHDELKKITVNLASRLPRDNPVVSSLYSVWKSAEYHERETYDMIGIVFEGHPRLERLLLPEDWVDIPPLRKEFKLPGRD